MLKITTNFSDGVHFLDAFQLNRNSARPSYALITIASIFNSNVGLSLERLLCPNLPDPISLSERTSDNQRLNFCFKAVHTEKSTGLRYCMTIRWPVFRVDKLRNMKMKLQVSNCVTLTLR